MNPRRHAATLLEEIIRDRSSLAQLALDPNNEDSALVQELCYGVCRHYQELDSLAAGFLKKPLRDKDLDIQCLILLGLYQLFYMRIPDHAVINETVAAIKKSWARGLVNAVLRNARRHYPDYSPAGLATLHQRLSHPEWLCEALADDWPQQVEAILHANNQRPPMTLRVNLQRSERAAYLDTLAEAGIDATPTQLADTGITLTQALPVHALPGFDDGLFSVQDEASQLVATLLEAQPGMRVLDACAAPGGKTCALLERCPDLEVLAVDNEAKRLSRVTQNLARLGLKAATGCHDASALPARAGTFQRILIDAPCSAVGVIRRHPDIKVLRRPEQLAELQRKQQSLLRALWPRLERGGRLLYTTCSTLRRENDAQVAAFLADNQDARHLPIAVDWGQPLDYGRQLLPGEYNQDGFYYALLEKC